MPGLVVPSFDVLGRPAFFSERRQRGVFLGERRGVGKTGEGGYSLDVLYERRILKEICPSEN